MCLKIVLFLQVERCCFKANFEVQNWLCKDLQRWDLYSEFYVCLKLIYFIYILFILLCYAFIFMINIMFNFYHSNHFATLRHYAMVSYQRFCLLLFSFIFVVAGLKTVFLKPNLYPSFFSQHNFFGIFALTFVFEIPCHLYITHISET